jgi:hypothetical protein
MDDRELTRQLAGAVGVDAPAELATLFDLGPELVEWSINSGPDPRGALRVSAWTRDRGRAAAALARLAPGHVATREQLLDDDYEGLGLALRAGSPPSVRWWALADEGVRMADKARAHWSAHEGAIEALLAAVGGPHACTAVGIEASARHRRETVYVRLATPAAAIRVLELAAVPVTKATNLFWKGICGLEPGGRPWPKVWAGRSFGSDAGWKFYYFARGDDHRRTDEVLLAAIDAPPALRHAQELVRAVTSGPCVQLLGLTIRTGRAPTFTVYLARI